MPCAIIRPTLVFGKGDPLLNDIVWVLWHIRVFHIFRRGDYRSSLCTPRT